MQKFAIHTPTQADYDRLMIELEKIGATWNGGRLPTANPHYWADEESDTAIEISDLSQLFRDCTLCYIGWGFTILTLEEGLKYLQSMNNEQRSEVTSKENLRVGDFILATDGTTAKVLAICGDLFARSMWGKGDEEERRRVIGGWYTFDTVAERGWKILPPPTAPVKMTVAEIAKKLGHDVEVVK